MNPITEHLYVSRLSHKKRDFIYVNGMPRGDIINGNDLADMLHDLLDLREVTLYKKSRKGTLIVQVIIQQLTKQLLERGELRIPHIGRFYIRTVTTSAKSIMEHVGGLKIAKRRVTKKKKVIFNPSPSLIQALRLD